MCRELQPAHHPCARVMTAGKALGFRPELEFGMPESRAEARDGSSAHASIHGRPGAGDPGDR